LEPTSRPGLHPGAHVSLSGRYVSTAEPLSSRDGLRLGATRFAVEGVAPATGTALGQIQQALVNPPKYTVRAAVVLLNFNGKDPQQYTVAQARVDLARVHDYYLEVSYGAWTMNTDVFGPYLVDLPSTCDLGTLTDLAKSTARAQAVDIDSYEHVGVTIPNVPADQFSDKNGCPCGVANVGTTPAEGIIANGGVSLYTCLGDNAFAHEMGHGIGFNHSSTAPCNGVAYRPGLQGCDIIEYGNRYNTMGGGLGHFNAMQKATMGWLNGCNINRVSADGEFDLAPIQMGVDNATQGLQIDTGDSSGGQPLYFYVEYRNPALAKFNALKDDGTPRERGPGLHVTVSRDFRVTQGEGRTILIDASNGLKGLPKDGSDADQASGDPRMLVGDVFKPNDKVTIQFVSSTENNAHVKVSFPGGGSGTNACQSSVPPAGPPALPAGFVATLFQNCNYNIGGPGWSANLTAGNYATKDLAALGVRDNDTSSLVLAPGYEAILYEDDNLSGRMVTMHDTLNCFVRIDMNDALSSIEIRANGMATGADAGAGPDASTGIGDDAGSRADGGGQGRAGSGGSAGSGGAGSGGAGGPGGGPGQANTGSTTAGCSYSAGAQTESMPWTWLAFGLCVRARGVRWRSR
ncbi:MAG TPA: hypothetical protein VGL59_11600, partial [Polyangia bacterium]